VSIMNEEGEDSFRKRYDAGLARERAGNETWARQRFGAPLGQSLLKELPLLAGLFLFLLLIQGWVWAVCGLAVMLAVILLFRAGARRRYGIRTQPPPPES
jgi:hypothetical protein